MTEPASSAPLTSSPWRRVDRVALLATTAIGVLLVGAGWLGASDATAVGPQVRWVNAAVVGVIVLGAGNALWLLTGRRAAGRLRRRVVGSEELRRRLAVPVERIDRLAAPTTGPVAVRGMSRYHRPDCPLVAGKPVLTTSVRRARRPCGICLPDGAPALRGDAGA